MEYFLSAAQEGKEMFRNTSISLVISFSTERVWNPEMDGNSRCYGLVIASGDGYAIVYMFQVTGRPMLQGSGRDETISYN